MEVSFTLWSLKGVLEKIPLDEPAPGQIHLDFSSLAVPYYVKHGFKVSFLYEDGLPYDACCCIYSPESPPAVVTVVIIMNRRYEVDFKDWLEHHDDKYLESCCLRRELYCHEACHLVAIIRAYPGDRTSRAREDFKKKLEEKFTRSVGTAEDLQPVPLVSMEQSGISPSVFDKDHFRYGNDNVNYFRLYQELMLDYERMSKALDVICARLAPGEGVIYINDVSRETLVPVKFFEIFPEKITALKELLAEKISKAPS
jgi:hypothetical protein